MMSWRWICSHLYEWHHHPILLIVLFFQLILLQILHYYPTAPFLLPGQHHDPIWSVIHLLVWIVLFLFSLPSEEGFFNWWLKYSKVSCLKHSRRASFIILLFPTLFIFISSTIDIVTLFYLLSRLNPFHQHVSTKCPAFLQPFYIFIVVSSQNL